LVGLVSLLLAEGIDRDLHVVQLVFLDLQLLRETSLRVRLHLHPNVLQLLSAQLFLLDVLLQLDLSDCVLLNQIAPDVLLQLIEVEVLQRQVNLHIGPLHVVPDLLEDIYGVRPLAGLELRVEHALLVLNDNFRFRLLVLTRELLLHDDGLALLLDDQDFHRP